MSIAVKCPGCGATLRAPDGFAAKKGRCPKCNTLNDLSAVPKPEELQCFECSRPSGDGRCSDNACPCPEVVIPRGTGYLHIDQQIVEFRRRYPSEEAARKVMEDKFRSLGIGGSYRLAPILVCEQGAKLRKLDLRVAAADAKYWWDTGKVPLRATPTGS